MELTKSEMEIMDVLWAEQAPLSRSDLLERSEEKTWKDRSGSMVRSSVRMASRMASSPALLRP